MKVAPNEFFNQLLSEASVAFHESPIYKNNKDRDWHYSICATPIVQNRAILFGINWGGSEPTQPQSELPDGKDIVEYHFIKRGRPYFEKHLGFNFETLNFNYANLCFFRSPRQSDLCEADYRLSLPLFRKFVEYVNPPWLLSIGFTNFDALLRLNEIQDFQRHTDPQDRLLGYSGKLWDWKVVGVPHPSARLSNEARERMWAFTAEEIEKLPR